MTYASHQYERKYLNTPQENKEHHEIIERIAQFYGWQTIVETGLDLKDKGSASERAMERSLYYYGIVHKKSDARVIYQRYCTLRQQIEPAWGQVIPSKDEQTRCLVRLERNRDLARLLDKQR